MAVALRDARDGLRAAESELEDLLSRLYPGWRPLFPAERAWRFDPPDNLHVYHAADSAESAAELHREGFARVTVHAHRARPDPCGCLARSG